MLLSCLQAVTMTGRWWLMSIELIAPEWKPL
jgi:hypothetical protein